MRRYVGAGVLVCLAGCARFAGNEGLLAIDFQTRGLSFTDDDVIPDDVRSDLEHLNRAYMGLRERLHAEHADAVGLGVQTSPGGRALAAYEYGVDRSGVWVWPNWRDADHIVHLPDVGFVHFVCDRYLLANTADQQTVIDLHADGQAIDAGWRFMCTKLDVSNDGRFVALIPTRPTVGYIRADSFEEVAAVDMPGVIDVFLVHDGDVVILTTADEARSFRFPDLVEPVSVVPGLATLALHDGFWLRRDDDFRYVRVDNEGRLTVEWVHMSGIDNERPVGGAPSGQFFHTHRDGWVPGASIWSLRTFPWVSGPEPSSPRGYRGGWLAWIRRAEDDG